MSAGKLIPIVVDLDGTLVRDDTLYVFVWQMLRKKPWTCFMLPISLLKGKAAMKQYMASVHRFDPTRLDFHAELIVWLKQQKDLGRKIVLCTASSQQVADTVTSQLGFFDEVIGSGTHINLSGSRKAALLVERYGRKGFDYCGNASIDLAVWKQSNAAIVVNAKPGLAEQAAKLCPVAMTFK